MFFQTREAMLENLRLMGSRCCAYGTPGVTWPDNRCDCKFGAEAFGKTSGGEQTGCPELRSVYEVIEAMSEADWDRFILDAGGVCIEYMNDRPKSQEAMEVAGRIAATDSEFARTLAALNGTPSPVLEAVLLAQRPERQAILQVLGMREDDGSQAAELRLSGWGRQVIDACAQVLPAPDTDVDAAIERLRETVGGRWPASKAR